MSICPASGKVGAQCNFGRECVFGATVTQQRQSYREGQRANGQVTCPALTVDSCARDFPFEFATEPAIDIGFGDVLTEYIPGCGYSIALNNRNRMWQESRALASTSVVMVSAL